MNPGATTPEGKLALGRFAAGQPPVASFAAIRRYLDCNVDPRPMIRTDAHTVTLNLGRGSTELGEPLSGLTVERFGRLIEQRMQRAGTAFAFGRWGERREVYANELFSSESSSAMRDVHLGVDVFCAAGTEIVAPIDGRVSIKANNAQELDYGPLLIVEHRTADGQNFFSLYGHLSADSIEHIRPGDAIAAGERLARVGSPPENGNWPPHLHFQLVVDLLGMGSDFPGVAFPQQKFWLEISPCPRRFFPEFADLLDATVEPPRQTG